jgi:hypothetical protein
VEVDDPHRAVGHEVRIALQEPLEFTPALVGRVHPPHVDGAVRLDRDDAPQRLRVDLDVGDRADLLGDVDGAAAAAAGTTGVRHQDPSH